MWVWFADELEERIENINEYFTFSLYSNVCRSLFEQHKLLFSFLLCVRILQNDNKMDMVHTATLLCMIHYVYDMHVNICMSCMSIVCMLCMSCMSHTCHMHVTYLSHA